MTKNYFNINKNNIIKLFNEKKFNKISKISKIILEKFQNDTDLLYLIIISEINCNNLIKAENLTNDLLNIKKSKEIHYLLGNILKLQNKNKEAILAYKNSIDLDETFSEAYNNLANVQKKINQVDEAYNNYEKAIKYNKKNLQAYFNLANLFRSEKKFDMAIVNFKNVINIDQNFAQAYSNIGQIYASLGNILEAEKYIQLAIDKDEQHQKIRELEKNKIQVSAMFILGFPSDTENSMSNTIEYAKKLNTTYAQFSVWTPYPGTPVFEEYKDKISVKSYEEYDQYNLVYKHNCLSESKVRFYLEKSYENFYLRFKWIKKFIFSFI